METQDRIARSTSRDDEPRSAPLGATDGRAHALENRVPPPLLLLAIAVFMTGLARQTPALNATPLVLLGAVVVAAGLALVVTGFRTFRGAGTTIDPVRVDAARALVTHGLFARTRNPMYVGFTTALLGWAIILGARA